MFATGFPLAFLFGASLEVETTEGRVMYRWLLFPGYQLARLSREEHLPLIHHLVSDGAEEGLHAAHGNSVVAVCWLTAFYEGAIIPGLHLVAALTRRSHFIPI